MSIIGVGLAVIAVAALTGGGEKEVTVAKVPVVEKGVIVKPGQNKVRYINGMPYYDTLIQYTDGGSSGKRKRKIVRGYAKKSDFDALNVSTVDIPANFAGLEAVMVPTRLQEQLFRICEVVEDEDCVTITARHVWYDNLQNYTLWKPTKNTEYTVAETCRNIIDNAISPVASRVASDCQDKITHKETAYEKKNIVECFLDPQNGVCAKYGLSLIRNNWDFYCLKAVGYDRGMIIQNGKNLLGVERKESIDSLVTRIAPIGKDKKGNVVWLDYNSKKYIDSQYIDEYSYPRVEIYETGLQIGKDGVTADNIQDKLLEAAQKRFSDEKVDLPSVEMKIEFLSLGDTEEYKQYRDLDKVYLYDIITIKDTIRDYSYTAQVIGVEHDVLTGQLLSVTIGKLDNWDGTRKIATWQVPEVSGENIRLQTIMAGSFESQAIQAEDIGDGVIAYAHFAEATINALTADSLTAVSAQIHELIAGSITADDIVTGSLTSSVIAAGAITAEKIASQAISSDKIQANAITANLIAANAINADKIDTSAINAINAKLGTANIARAEIQAADISYAQVKELSAGSAFVGQAVIQEGIADKLFIPRLSVAYAQIVSATIGDLVIQATDDRYYKLDVDLSGNVTATEVTPTAEEIEQGHTSDGRTIYTETDIVAEDLSTTNIYASHALMDEITANIINVDKLFAREATISHINALDLSSNTYIQSTIGDWQSGSTITQTIAGISSRISELGYGTIYYSTTEPDHEHLVQGDLWVQPLSDHIWDDYTETAWQDILDGGSWGTVLGNYKVYTWSGQYFKLLFDNTVNLEMWTAIEQNTAAIALKANQTTVDLLSDDVTEFAGILEVQSQEISAAVSAVNLKASSYVMWADPTTVYTVSLGDLWIKRQADFGTWAEASEHTWQYIKDNFIWKDALGSETYVWDGTEWVLTSDRASEVTQKTLIDQNSTSITLLAETSAKLTGLTEDLGEQTVTLRAELVVANDRISTEVSRAIAAEETKIAKTTTYQTADEIYAAAVATAKGEADETYIVKTSSYQTAESIVTEAVRQAGVNAGSSFIAKTTSYQTADAIVNEAVRQSGVSAGNKYLAKTSTYQTADSITTEAVRQAGVNASAAYLAKTSTYQTADSIVSAAQSYTNGKLSDYSTTTQTSTMISQYVTNNAYGKVSGITITASGIDISGSQYVKIASGGYLSLKSGDFGIDTSQSGVCLWAGSGTAENANFRVKKNGEVTLTKLLALNESGTESEVNLRTAGLWKLNYSTIRTYSTDGGYVSSITLSGGTVLNFKSAATARAEGYAEAANVSYSRRIGNTVSCQIPTANGGVSASTYTASTDNSFAIHWGASKVIDGTVYVLARDTYLTGSAWVTWS